MYLRGSPSRPALPIPQLLDHAGDAYLGPPLLNGERLPFPSYPGGQVTVRWVAEHSIRKYGDGRQEVIGEERYRPFFEFTYDLLEAVVQAGIWEVFRSGAPLTFAPYSLDGVAHPATYPVLPPKEIPDTADLVLSRFPFGLALEGVFTYGLDGITTTTPQNPTFQHPPTANVAAGMRVLPIGISFDPAGMAVGEYVDPCAGAGGPSGDGPAVVAEPDAAGMSVEPSQESTTAGPSASESTAGFAVKAPPSEPPPPSAEPAGMSVAG